MRSDQHAFLPMAGEAVPQPSQFFNAASKTDMEAHVRNWQCADMSQVGDMSPIPRVKSFCTCTATVHWLVIILDEPDRLVIKFSLDVLSPSEPLRRKCNILTYQILTLKSDTVIQVNSSASVTNIYSQPRMLFIKAVSGR